MPASRVSAREAIFRGTTTVIVTVALNAAVDVTYEVDELSPAESHRVQRVHVRPGGKAVNVAQVLHRRGVPVLVTGLAGGTAGRFVQAELDERGIRHEFVPIGGSTRNTVTVVSTTDAAATVFNEPGPTVHPAEWEAFLERFERLSVEAHVVVLAGSVPPGVPEDAYAELVQLASAAGAVTIVDAGSDTLRHAVPAGPTVVKTNADELLDGIGGDSVMSSIETVLAAGVQTAIVTMGAAGLLAATRSRRWRVVPPEAVRGNATGAGDACTAAIAEGLLAGHDVAELLREAVALSAATVAAPTAGELDGATYARVHAGARVVDDPDVADLS
jgi:tagatose 6-phosphate kinase